MFGNTVRKLGIKRSDLVVSSKIFNHYNNEGLGPNEIGLSRKHLREGMEDILGRLEMDYVDVISAHRPDNLTPIEETVRGFNWLIDNGHALVSHAVAPPSPPRSPPAPAAPCAYIGCP